MAERKYMHADAIREQRLDSISACLHKKKYWRLPLVDSPLIIYHTCTLANELPLAALFTFVHTVAREHAVCVGIYQYTTKRPTLFVHL